MAHARQNEDEIFVRVARGRGAAGDDQCLPAVLFCEQRSHHVLTILSVRILPRLGPRGRIRRPALTGGWPVRIRPQLGQRVERLASWQLGKART